MQVLIDELKKPEYIGKTDQQAADIVNAKTVAVRQLVPLWQVLEHSCRNQYRANLETARADLGHPCRSMAINILAYLDSPRLETVDMDDQDTRAILAGMVACGFASQENIDELIALADATIPWAAFHELGIVGVGLVHNARKEINHAQ